MSLIPTPGTALISRRRLLAGGVLAGSLLATGPARAAARGASINPALLRQARAAFDRHRARIGNTRFIGIADYGLHSAEPRFYLFAPDSGQVTSLRVAHGRGSDPAHTGFLQRFSGQPGSAASSDGAYLTGAPYVGQHGRSRRLIGLEPQNSTAEARAIVIHGAWYCEPAVVRQTGKLGRSEGCFAFSAADAALVLDQLPAGCLLYSGRA